MNVACERQRCPGCGGHKDFYARASRGCSTVPIPDRIVAASIPEPNTGCWLWIGATFFDRSGTLRGRLSINDRSIIAYRVAYEAFRGPIPAGMELDHLCRLPLCVNPGHLEPVTSQENQRRGKGSYPTCKRGHPFNEANTATRFNRRLGKAQRSCRKCEVLRMQASRERRRQRSA